MPARSGCTPGRRCGSARDAPRGAGTPRNRRGMPRRSFQGPHGSRLHRARSGGTRCARWHRRRPRSRGRGECSGPDPASRPRRGQHRRSRYRQRRSRRTPRYSPRGHRDRRSSVGDASRASLEWSLALLSTSRPRRRMTASDAGGPVAALVPALGRPDGREGDALHLVGAAGVEGALGDEVVVVAADLLTSSRRPRSPRHSCERGMAPAMQAAHSSTLRRVRSFSGRPLTMSASASRPPGRSTRAASSNTLLLSTERLITPLEMTASKLASPNGSRSMRASRIGLGEPVAARRVALSTCSRVKSTPTTWPPGPT